MKTSFILVLCFALAYCADWRKFQEGTHTTLTLLEERLKSLEKHTQVLVNKPEKEGIDVVKENVKDELGHLSELEKSVKEELTKNHTLISQNFFLEKAVFTINLIRAELNQLEKILEDVEKKIGSTFVFYAANEPSIDYREKYDHLLMESINEKLRFGEQFLETVSHQVHEFQRTHDEELHQTLLRHINIALPMIQGIEHHFEEELKKTGLNTIERFTIEKAKAECLLLIKALTQVYDVVRIHPLPKSHTKAPVFFAPAQAPTDWRQAYDQLLFSFVEEHIRRADEKLLRLQRELKEYQTTKNKELHDRIVSEIEREISLLNGTQQQVANELKRTDLDHIERYLYEKSKDETELLIKHYTQIQASIKALVVVVRSAEIYFAPIATDWRQAYDELLFAFIDQHIRRADADLLILQREIKEYQKSKDKELKDKILNQVNREIPMLKTTQEHAVRELQRTDLNHIERFLYEKSKDQTEILIKHFTQIQTEINKVVVVRSAEEFFAPPEAPTDWRQAYDQLLFSFINEHIQRADYGLLRLQRELKEYQTTKNKELKDKIVREVETEISLLKGTHEHAVRELQRTDLDHVERFLYEKSRDQTEILIKHYTQIENAVKV
jgi:hypothetical protein